MDPIGFFTEPFAYDFMQRALGMSLLVAAVCAVLSCYLVLKGWSLMGDAIAHAVLPGIVIAFVLGIPLVIGAFAAGLVQGRDVMDALALAAREAAASCRALGGLGTILAERRKSSPPG